MHPFDGHALVTVLALTAAWWIARAVTHGWTWRCHLPGCRTAGAGTRDAVAAQARHHYLRDHYTPATGCPPCARGEHSPTECHRYATTGAPCECACALRARAEAVAS